jgi:hypothetical protein
MLLSLGLELALGVQSSYRRLLEAWASSLSNITTG